jgi:hypothetical protein
MESKVRRYNPAQLRSQVEMLFDVIPDRSQGDELVFLCPEPGCGDRSGNRSVNLRTGKTNCWRCNKGGDFVRWATQLGYPVEIEEEPGLAVGELSGMVAGLGVPEGRQPSYVPQVCLPAGFTLLADEPDGAYARLIGRMAERKNLDLADFIEAGVGFTRVDPRWEPYAIFPVFEWGRVVYYQGRTYTDEPDRATKQFPSRSEVKLGSRHWLYNFDELRERGGVAIVVEAILNVRSLRRELAARGVGATPVACFKHKVSAEQLGKLSSVKGLAEVCLMFDADALASAYEECRRLQGGVPVTVVKMPSDAQGRKVDPNDDARLAADLFAKRGAYSEYESLLSRLP